MAVVPALAAPLAGCGASDAPVPQHTVTVTQSTGPTPTSTGTPTASSDVRGRAHDVGSIASVSTVGGVQVLDVDRWSATGVSDSTVARDGIPVAPHQGQRYTNQNTRKTYTVPVAPSVMVVVNVCTPGPDGQLGMTAEPVDAAAWLRSPDPSAVLLLTYDSDGALTRVDTDPRCS